MYHYIKRFPGYNDRGICSFSDDVEIIPNFLASELACPCCGKIQFHTHFEYHLYDLRLDMDRPLVLNSACRCSEHNKTEDGHPRSLHLTENPVHATLGSCAVDIAWRDWLAVDKKKLVNLARFNGWSVGIANGFCHIDRRVDAGLTRTDYSYKGAEQLYNNLI